MSSLEILPKSSSGNKLVTPPPRLFYLDWLRVIVILNLIPFHVAWMMVVVPGFSNIPENSVASQLFSLYLALIAPLHMPLLFAISGYSAAIALQKKSTVSYLRERLQRLILPLISFIFLLSPILTYFFPSDLQERNLKHFIFEFIPYFILTAFNGYSGAPRWAHLWFVGYLFLFTLISLPLFLYWKNSNALVTVSNVISSYVGMFIPSLLFSTTFILGCFWPFFSLNMFGDLAYFSYNLLAFIIGYIICMDKKNTDIIDCNLRLWIGIWSISTLIIVVMISADFPTIFYRPTPTLSGQYCVYSLLAGLNTWSGLAAILGLAKKYLCFSNRFLSYMSRSSYMYYILHLVVLVTVGYFTPRPQGVFSEFLVLSILTLALTALCYEFIVKRLAIVRLLFGIKA
ncbi:acyltransferase family protein [Moorena sp. SIO4G3]|uniref:acyltransferase family protein n=1 Tax=Moorena sp. SIO4G3 TaxID=2607821 RepID=UPI001428F3C0|nr:acyltransferase family protein [Moorena sp. SIO4G3]NEO76945.1 acyltransferase family protein [Moorena sp. SIO4G3]